MVLELTKELYRMGLLFQPMRRWFRRDCCGLVPRRSWKWKTLYRSVFPASPSVIQSPVFYEIATAVKGTSCSHGIAGTTMLFGDGSLKWTAECSCPHKTIVEDSVAGTRTCLESMAYLAILRFLLNFSWSIAMKDLFTSVFWLYAG